jgi:uncharacterized protein YktB (UPF0637 family)
MSHFLYPTSYPQVEWPFQTQNCKKAQLYKSLIQGALSKIRKTFQDLFQKDEVKVTYNHPHEVEIPYDNLFPQNPGLSELDDQSINEKVDGFMKAQGKSEKLWLEDQVKAEKLKVSLHKLHTLQKENFKDLNPIWDAHKTFSAKIRPILLQWKSDGNL